jgi:hypothetical protein
MNSNDITLKNRVRQIELLIDETLVLIEKELELLPATVKDRWRIKTARQLLEALQDNTMRNSSVDLSLKLEHCKKVMSGIFYGWVDAGSEFTDSIQVSELPKHLERISELSKWQID